MTVSVVQADTGSPRHGWRSLLWLAPLTALWIVLIYWQPIIPTSGVPTTLHQLTVHGFIALGLWLGLERTDLTPDQRRTTRRSMAPSARAPHPCRHCRWRSSCR
jgi:hypothetical protein